MGLKHRVPVGLGALPGQPGSDEGLGHGQPHGEDVQPRVGGPVIGAGEPGRESIDVGVQDRVDQQVIAALGNRLVQVQRGVQVDLRPEDD